MSLVFASTLLLHANGFGGFEGKEMMEGKEMVSLRKRNEVNKRRRKNRIEVKEKKKFLFPSFMSMCVLWVKQNESNEKREQKDGVANQNDDKFQKRIQGTRKEDRFTKGKIRRIICFGLVV
jgi:hypothetical protein